jgi:hypothetical protein
MQKDLRSLVCPRKHRGNLCIIHASGCTPRPSLAIRTFALGTIQVGLWAEEEEQEEEETEAFDFAGLWSAARLGAAASDPALSIEVPSQVHARIQTRSATICGAAWCGGQPVGALNRQGLMLGFRLTGLRSGRVARLGATASNFAFKRSCY